MIGRPRGRALLLGSVVAVVLGVLGVAVAVLDSPAEQRRLRLDERRVDDLRALGEAMDLYWSEEGALPPDLDTLAGWRGMEVSTTDPESGEPYGYSVTDSTTYELCATFTAPFPTPESRNRWHRHPTAWQHPAGVHCFELEAESVSR